MSFVADLRAWGSRSENSVILSDVLLNKVFLTEDNGQAILNQVVAQHMLEWYGLFRY